MNNLDNAKKLVTEINQDISFDAQIDESRIKQIKDELIGTGYGLRLKESGIYFEIETLDHISKKMFKRMIYTRSGGSVKQQKLYKRNLA